VVFVAGVRGRPRGRPQTTGEGNHDMRLTITTNVSVDGVMQGLGGPGEDRRGGFDRGGWAFALLDTEAGDHINEVYGGATAFLFGRRTYEIFAGSWGAMAEMIASPIGTALNSRPKYVVSTSSPTRSGRARVSSPATSPRPLVIWRRSKTANCSCPAAAPSSDGCSPTSWSTSSSCSPIPSSSARAHGCSPIPVRTSRSIWSTRGPLPGA